jgi:hypothetical protein
MHSPRRSSLRRSQRVAWCALAVLLLNSFTMAHQVVAEDAGKALGRLGGVAKWRSVDVQLTGPASQSAGRPNPFAIVVDGVFTAPSGRQWKIPGFYDGDGRGGPDGNVWRVRFSADETGRWTFASESAEHALDGWTATFDVTPASEDAAEFHRWGRLEAVGTAENGIRYLKFRDGPYWLKAGCDDPENFLGGYKNYDTLAKRKAAVDYLAERGINSMYIMSHNLDGDDKDVWPWLGPTAKEAKANSAGDVRFDVTKLRQWRELFEHVQQRGVVVYLVLEDDSAWKGYDHARYYREIAARFGDLPGLVFNLGEEHNENYKLAEGLALAGQLADADPYDHPRGIHNVNAPNDAYIDSPQIDFTAIQTGSPGSRRGLENALAHNRIAIDWLRRCASRGKRPLVVNFDEGRPEQQRAAWWAAYLAGGVWEAHVLEPYDRPMSAWETTWHELGGARAFMESLPFWEMEPHNELVQSGEALCLAKPSEAYALYLPSGGKVTIDLPAGGEYDFAWWNPASGAEGRFTGGGRVPGGRQTFTAPSDSDWSLRVLMRKP